MKTITKIVFFSILAVTLLTSCPPDEEIPNEYESCCGTEPVEFSVQGTTARVYVPNVFTPNGDGINDQFFPFSNGQITTINYMVIQKIEDDLSTTLLYQVADIDANDLYNYAWDGVDMQGNKHKGGFDYTISFTTTDSLSFAVQGKGCSMSCEGQTTTAIPKEGCFYPSQSDDGRLNILIPSGEYEFCF